ncbi:MAG TPA: hypothetical protein VFF26_02145 [Gallionella sp.]|nr:hypothetical protein [Gallionella sp.]
MKNIAIVTLLYAIAAQPVCASDNSTYAFPEPDMDTPLLPDAAAWKSELARLTWFSLLREQEHEDEVFSLYGGLFIPRLHAGGAEAGIRHNTATYGLHGQLNSSPKLDIRFGLDRYIAGKNAGDNVYSLSARVKF